MCVRGSEVHGLVDVRRQAQGSHPETELPEPLAVHESSPSSPCGRKRGRERWGGGRGANFEVVEVAVHDQHVIAVAALRKKTRSGSVGRADAEANVEVVAVAGRGQRVVVVAALVFRSRAYVKVAHGLKPRMPDIQNRLRLVEISKARET